MFHFAFAVQDVVAVKDRLIGEGASLVEEINLPDGSPLFMPRDPWEFLFRSARGLNRFNSE